MYIIHFIFTIFFIAHGFCDFLPLIYTFNKRATIYYILSILLFAYIHVINHSVSTLIFLLISSIHFSEDYKPYNEIMLPGFGFYILGAPIISDYNTYYEYLEIIDIINIELFLSIMYFGGILGLLNSYKPEYNDIIINYTVLSLISGIHSVFLYMIYYHLPISLYLLSKKYKVKKVLTILVISSIFLFIIYWKFYNIILEFILLHKTIVIGFVFGLLNTHCITTILWR